MNETKTTSRSRSRSMTNFKAEEIAYITGVITFNFAHKMYERVDELYLDTIATCQKWAESFYDEYKVQYDKQRHYLECKGCPEGHHKAFDWQQYVDENHPTLHGWDDLLMKFCEPLYAEYVKGSTWRRHTDHDPDTPYNLLKLKWDIDQFVEDHGYAKTYRMSVEIPNLDGGLTPILGSDILMDNGGKDPHSFHLYYEQAEAPKIAPKAKELSAVVSIGKSLIGDLIDKPSEDYIRGVCELIADMFPTHEVPISETAEKVRNLMFPIKKWQYKCSSESIWTSFDHGTVAAYTYDEAMELAKSELKEALDRANSALDGSDNSASRGYELNMDFRNIEIEEIK